MVIGSAIGISGSIPRIVSRRAPANWRGSPSDRMTRFAQIGPQTSAVWGKYISGRGGLSAPHCMTSATTPTTRAR